MHVQKVLNELIDVPSSGMNYIQNHKNLVMKVETSFSVPIYV